MPSKKHNLAFKLQVGPWIIYHLRMLTNIILISNLPTRFVVWNVFFATRVRYVWLLVQAFDKIYHHWRERDFFWVSLITSASKLLPWILSAPKLLVFPICIWLYHDYVWTSKGYSSSLRFRMLQWVRVQVIHTIQYDTYDNFIKK